MRLREDQEDEMAKCKHEWKEYTSRGHTYVCCSRCHTFPMRHLTALHQLDGLKGAIAYFLREYADECAEHGLDVYWRTVLEESKRVHGGE